MSNRKFSLARLQAWAAIAVVMAVGVAGVVSGTSAASGGATSDADPTQYVDQDVANLASAIGISPDAAQQYGELQPAVNALDDEAQRSYPETYGGLSRDPATGVVTLSFTRDASGAMSTLGASFPSPSLLVPRSVRYSLAGLNAALDRVTTDMPALLAADAHNIAYAYVDVPNNRVTVALINPSTDERGALRATYGDLIDVIAGSPARTAAEVPDLCTSRQVCTTYIRGGIKIDGGGWACTSGFAARRRSDSKPVVLTAGHCFDTGTSVNFGSAPLGAVTARQFSGNVDGEIIPASAQWGMSNWLYYTNSNKQLRIRTIVGTESVSDGVCRVGITTGPLCGTITAVNATINITGGPTLTNQRMANMCAIPGDSGGPVKWSDVAHGVTSAGNFTVDSNGTPQCNTSPWTSYSGLRNVQNALGADVAAY